MTTIEVGAGGVCVGRTRYFGMLVVAKGGLPPLLRLGALSQRRQATLQDHKHAKQRVIPEPPFQTTSMPLVLVFSHVSLLPLTIDPQPVVSLTRFLLES